MVSSHNRMEYQRRHAVYQVPHYGLRNLSVGVASVLLSTTFFLGRAHADEVSSNNVGTESTLEVTSMSLFNGVSESQSSGSVDVRQNGDAVEASQTNLMSTSPASSVQSIASQSTSAQSVNVISNSYNSVVSTVNINTVNTLVSASSSFSEPPVQASSVGSVPTLHFGSDSASQSTSSLVKPSVQYPVTDINVSPNINLSDPRVDASEFRLGFRDVATHQLVGLNDVVGKLGTSLQDVDFKLPDHYEAVNTDWQKNLPELSTGKFILDVGQTGSVSLAQARAKLLQEQQQEQLAALFGNSFVVLSGNGATSVANRSYGIDVSDYQGSDMAAYARRGAKFAIIKICEGMSPSGGTTSWTKAANAKAAGMMVMGYQFYHYAGSVQGAINQANYAIQRAHEAGIPLHSYLAIDWESEYGPNHGSYEEDTAEAIAWMQTVRNAGYLPMFYSGPSYAQSYFNLNQILQRFPGSLWIASYPYSTYNKASDSAPMAYFPSMNGVAIWQFTNDMYGMNTDGNINVLPLQFLQVQPSVLKQATVHVRFIDDDEGGKVVGTPSRTYNFNTTFKYSDFGLPTEYHWVNGQSGNTIAHLGTGDLTLDIHLRHNTDNRSDSKTVTRHWEIDMPDGQVKYGDQHATFNRNGWYDRVTKQMHWNNWSPAQQLPAVNVPASIGYTASGKIGAMTITPDSQDSTVTITYKKIATPVTPGHDNHPSNLMQDQFVVNVIDVDNTNHQIKHETVKSLPLSYNSYIPTNYRLAGYNLDGQTLTIKVGHQVQAVTDNKTVIRQIVIVMPNGQKQTGQQSVTFGRAGVKDLVTGQTNWKNWDPASYQFDSIVVPAVSGYTASGKIGAMTITPDSQDSTVTITYKKNSGTVTPGGDGHSSKSTQDSFIINVIDVDNNNRQIKHETVKSLPASYNSYIPTNYRLSGYNLDGHTLTIKVGHQVQAVTDNKTVTRQIVIVMPNGQKQTGQQSVTFGRAGVKDLVTGQTTWKSWDPASYQFDSIQVPVIAGFEASGTIDAMTVTPDNANSTIMISYYRIGSHSSQDGSSATSSTTSSATNSVTSSSVGHVDSLTITSSVTSSGTVSSTVVINSSEINSSAISQSNSSASQTSSGVVLSSGQGLSQVGSSVMNSQIVMSNGSSMVNSQVVNSISSLVSSGVVASHGQVSGFNSSVAQSSADISFLSNQLGLTRNISMNSMIGLDGLGRGLSRAQQDNTMSKLSNKIDNSKVTGSVNELDTVATNSRFAKGPTEYSDTESIGGFLNQSAVNNLSPSVVQIDRHSDGLGDQLSGGSNDNHTLPQTGYTQDVSAVMIGASLLLGAITVGATMKKKKRE